MKTKTTVVKHPTLPEVEREVPENEANGWLEAGWVAEAAQPTTTQATPRSRGTSTTKRRK